MRYLPTNLLAAMGVDKNTLDKRLGRLLHANRLEAKEISESEALSALGRAWRPDGARRCYQWYHCS